MDEAEGKQLVSKENLKFKIYKDVDQVYTPT